VGRHTFEARSKGYVDARQTSEIEFGERVSITLALVKSLNEGKVKIVASLSDAVIEIDGKQVGVGAWEGVLSAGGHQLVVRRPGYETYSADVALDADQERVVEIELKKEQSTAWVFWTVTGVLVAAGAGVTSYFVLRPAESSQVTGTFDPGVVPTLFRF